MNKIEQKIFPDLIFGEETYLETIKGPSHTCYSIKQCETREGGDIHSFRIEYDNIPNVISILQKFYIKQQIMPNKKVDNSVNFVQIVQTPLEKIISIIHQDYVGAGECVDKIIFQNGTLYFYGKNDYQARTNKDLFMQACVQYNILILPADENNEGFTHEFQQKFALSLNTTRDKVYR